MPSVGRSLEGERRAYIERRWRRRRKRRRGNMRNISMEGGRGSPVPQDPRGEIRSKEFQGETLSENNGEKRIKPIFKGNAVLTVESFFLVFSWDFPAYLSSLAQSTTSPMKEEASPSFLFPFLIRRRRRRRRPSCPLPLVAGMCHVRRRGTFLRSFLLRAVNGEGKTRYSSLAFLLRM